MKNTTLVMGILAVLATLSGCGIGDAGGVGVGGGDSVGSDAGSYNRGDCVLTMQLQSARRRNRRHGGSATDYQRA